MILDHTLQLDHEVSSEFTVRTDSCALISNGRTGQVLKRHSFAGWSAGNPPGNTRTRGTTLAIVS